MWRKYSEMAPKASPKAAPAPNKSVVEKRTEVIVALAEKAPAAARPYIEKAAPVIAQAVTLGEKALPYVQGAYARCLKFYKIIEPYHPEDLLPMLCGLIMCFFGGVYPMLIAAIEARGSRERAARARGARPRAASPSPPPSPLPRPPAKAFRMTGYETIRSGCSEIYSELVIIYNKSSEDDQKDDDGDGIPDVDQIDAQQLVLRKLALAAKTIDPPQLDSAIVAISSSALAVIATLKVQFARAITLGASIGEILKKPAHRFGSPGLKKLMPEEYHKWAPLLIDYTVKTVAITIAWTIQKVISAFHSAMRGGHLAGACLLNVLNKKGFIKFNDAESSIDEAIGYVLAALGLMFQLRSGFRLPFPLNIVFFPISVCEYMLVWIVNS